MRYGSKVVFYDINSGEVKKFPATDVNFAAAGAKFYAVISSIGNVILPSAIWQGPKANIPDRARISTSTQGMMGSW